MERFPEGLPTSPKNSLAFSVGSGRTPFLISISPRFPLANTIFPFVINKKESSLVRTLINARNNLASL